MKPGIKTTEFWTTLAADVAATVLVVTHRITPTEWTAMTGGVTGIYALVRSVVKYGNALATVAATLPASRPVSPPAAPPAAPVAQPVTQPVAVPPPQ